MNFKQVIQHWKCISGYHKCEFVRYTYSIRPGKSLRPRRDADIMELNVCPHCKESNLVFVKTIPFGKISSVLKEMNRKLTPLEKAMK